MSRRVSGLVYGFDSEVLMSALALYYELACTKTIVHKEWFKELCS